MKVRSSIKRAKWYDLNFSWNIILLSVMNQSFFDLPPSIRTSKAALNLLKSSRSCWNFVTARIAMKHKTTAYKWESTSEPFRQTVDQLEQVESAITRRIYEAKAIVSGMRYLR